MESPIKRGSLVRRIGEIEVAVVAFIDGTYALVDYPSTGGKTKTVYLPLSVLEIAPTKLSKPDARRGARGE
jgi:hypothetical protein